MLANSPFESRRGGRGSEVARPQAAATESSPHPTQADKGSPAPSLRAVRLGPTGPCGQLSGCPTAGRGCPAHVGRTGGTALRNAFFAGTPALLACGADGRSLRDPGASRPGPGQHLHWRSPCPQWPSRGPTSHLLQRRPLCPSECTAN